MKKITLLSLGAIAATTITSQAALTWTGAGDGTSLFQEANFLDDNGVIPAANTINPSTAVTAATGGLIDISSGTGSPSNFGGGFTTGVGNALNVGGGKTLGSSGSSGMNQGSGFANPLVAATIVGGSTINVQFAVNYAFSLDGASTLRLRGGGNSLNVSTVNFLDANSVLRFDDETYAAFNSEHASKVTAFGNALVFGTDAFVIEAGDNAVATSILTGAGVEISAVVVPEPSSTALLGLGGLALILRRRK